MSNQFLSSISVPRKEVRWVCFITNKVMQNKQVNKASSFTLLGMITNIKCFVWKLKFSFLLTMLARKVKQLVAPVHLFPIYH